MQKSGVLHTVTENIKRSSGVTLPNIPTFVMKLTTVSVMAASAERSFLYLKRNKTYIRSTTRQNRLTGLAFLGIHLQRIVDPEGIIERYFSEHSHRRQDARRCWPRIKLERWFKYFKRWIKSPRTICSSDGNGIVTD